MLAVEVVEFLQMLGPHKMAVVLVEMVDLLEQQELQIEVAAAAAALTAVHRQVRLEDLVL